MYRYPFKVSGCTQDKYWVFLGDDGKEYCDMNGVWQAALLRIGHDYPHLKTLRMCSSITRKVLSSKPLDIDYYFTFYEIKRPQVS